VHRWTHSCARVHIHTHTAPFMQLWFIRSFQKYSLLLERWENGILPNSTREGCFYHGVEIESIEEKEKKMKEIILKTIALNTTPPPFFLGISLHLLLPASRSKTLSLKSVWPHPVLIFKELISPWEKKKKKKVKFKYLLDNSRGNFYFLYLSVKCVLLWVRGFASGLLPEKKFLNFLLLYIQMLHKNKEDHSNKVIMQRCG